MDGPHSPFDAPRFASTSASRVTRSSARLAADSSSSASETPTIPAPASFTPPKTSAPSRKRKAAQNEASPPEEAPSTRRSKKIKVTEPEQTPTSANSRPKRQKKVPAQESSAAMSSGYDEGDTIRRTSSSRRRQASPPGTSAETSPQNLLPAGNQKKRGSRKSGSNEKSRATSAGSSNRKSKKALQKKDFNTTGSSFTSHEVEEEKNEPEQQEDEPRKDGSDDHSEEDERPSPDNDRMDEDDPFTSNLLGRMAGSSSISNTLRALGGMMSGVTGRLRGILENLRMKDDPSVQLIALTELSELFLISNEDNLAGHFSPDQFVKELVSLMQPNGFGEENPEMMLLACRCIANLMEAIPSSTASVVYGGAVPVLCQKLLEIHFIDLAEQALSTLEKISVEFPSSIVREGGLTACLTYLDFFATSTQRTAVTTAANCCRGIPEESFPVIKDVMPILLNVLSSNDQKVVEQGSLCVCRIIESFKWQDEKLEELISVDLLRAVLRLLLPGSTNLIGANIHTSFLRCLAIASRASPRISVELLRLNVVDTLYQILTGISPPSGTDDIASKIDKNVIMQALIRSPKDQIFETLNVICELLPTVADNGLTFLDELKDAGLPGVGVTAVATRSRTSPNDKRIKLLQESADEVRRFAIILFPTLMHAYTSTVNLNVRQKVLTAQLKMLSNFDTNVIQEALAGIPFASHVASILTQEENPILVTCALQIAEMLINRLGEIYKSQFHREGVIAEIKKLADRPLSTDEAERLKRHDGSKKDQKSQASEDKPPPATSQDEDMEVAEDDEEHHDEDDEEGDEDEDEDGSDSDSSEPEVLGSRGMPFTDVRDVITVRAQKFVKLITTAHSSENADEAASTVDAIRTLGSDLSRAYQDDNYAKGAELFARLANYFAKDGTDGITSYELLKSDIVDTLLQIFTNENGIGKTQARSAFLKAFMSASNGNFATGSADSPTTAFSVLVHKLQDLLSRTEHFEVITVHQNAFESNRHSATSMLAKQLRLKLNASDDSGIPKPYRNIMVSIHAIATFRALDDYLRPRISLADQPDLRRIRRQLLGSSVPKAPEDSERPGAEDPATPSSTGNRPVKTSKNPKTLGSNSTPDSSKTGAPSSLRRSSRRLEPEAGEAQTPQGRQPSNEGTTDSPLECADEEKLSGDNEDSADAGMDAILDDLDDDMEADEEDDPSAVNMEIANSGKVTARKEDGTRVATPQQSSQGSAMSAASASQRLAAARELLGTPSSLGRPMSYASAVQSTPQDWHIEFSINGQPISNDTTIYRAVHFTQGEPEEASGRVVWSAVHKITFKRVPGPPPAEPKSLSPPPESPTQSHVGLPPSLSRYPQTASILQLMGALHSMNNNLGDIVSNASGDALLKQEPLAQFINTKLTAKLNRQLEEPLIVASNCLPSWSEDLARFYPFLFPFESRHLFLQSTSFGYSRSMSRWQNDQNENASRRHRDERPFLGRTQRQKVRISRNRILESALKVMELYGSSPSILEVEYFEEVGTGLGPTLEFYATISREFSKKKLKLWRENESEGTSDFAFGKNGLFPAPMGDDQADNDNGKRLLHLFKMLGKFVARSMLDSRIIDISFNPTFFRVGSAANVAPSLGAVATVDKDLATSLKSLSEVVAEKRLIDSDSTLSHSDKQEKYKAIRIKDAAIEDLGLDFTLPGYPDIELEENGSKTDVTIDNVERYIERVLDLTLGSGVQKQVDAFRAGFSQVFPYSALRAFTPDELVMLFGRNEEDWSLETLMDSIKADHGFNLDSASIRNLLQTLSEYTATERRDFLQFVTGSPKLPIGGFKSLTPMFTIVCKPSEPPLTPDDYLPSVMTCVNYLKMPDYTSAEVLRQKLSVAIMEGQGAFHLS
ncbi:ubiquitin-protein ligase Ufd4 [Elsinoe ampelina]|uniref:HECT-type E3 ubiquitin transferase n=1 Tax=Elsinoe ampelina TaxID=302913 RepID=A0A6A6GDF9_9PEZI|nr:ubiquitin-protein ligase Ufd4 [Elsinoe ampelina]